VNDLAKLGHRLATPVFEFGNLLVDKLGRIHWNQSRFLTFLNMSGL
jgi:hypothetical protein